MAVQRSEPRIHISDQCKTLLPAASICMHPPHLCACTHTHRASLIATQTDVVSLCHIHALLQVWSDLIYTILRLPESSPHPVANGQPCTKSHVHIYAHAHIHMPRGEGVELRVLPSSKAWSLGSHCPSLDLNDLGKLQTRAFILISIPLWPPITVFS